MAAIPPRLETAVIAQAGEGWSARRIAEWLSTEHGVKTTHVTVQAMIKRLQGERAVVAKAVLRQKLASTLTTDLDRIEKHARQLDELADATFSQITEDNAAFARRGGGEDGPIYVEGRELYTKVTEQLRKITETKLKYSGADTPDENAPRPVLLIPPESTD